MVSESTQTSPARKVAPASVLLIIVLTTTIMVIATFGEYALGVLGPVLNAELSIPTSMIGVLTSIMFGAAGVVSLPAGWLADRASPAVLSLVQIVLAAIAFAAFVLADDEQGLIIVCIFVGAIMAMCNPLTNRMIVMYLPRTVHARVLGWKSIGPQLGALMAGGIFGTLTLFVEWRTLILVIAVLMLAFGIYSYFALRGRPMFVRGEVPLDPEETSDHQAPDKTRPIAWWLIPFTFFFGGAVSSLGAFIPVYASEDLSFTVAQAGAAGSLIAGVSIVARMLWIRMLTFTNATAILIIAGLSAAASCVVLAVAPQFGAVVFWISIILVGATALGANPISQIVLVRNVSPKHVGVLSALVGIGLYGGFTFQPWIMALVKDSIGFANSWFIVSISGLLSALVIVAYVLIHERPEKMRAKAAAAAAADAKDAEQARSR